MSGTFQLRRFFDGPVGDDFVMSSPLEVLPHLDEEHLDRSARDSSCSPAAKAPTRTSVSRGTPPTCIGAAGIPNRVDSWGRHWAHDWPLWRAMLPGYLDELVD